MRAHSLPSRVTAGGARPIVPAALAPAAFALAALVLLGSPDAARAQTSTAALRGYVTSKLERISRHFDQVVDIRVLLKVDNLKEKALRQRADCNIHVKGRDLFAESAHADLYAAVDELADKLDRQVLRYKTKTQEHNHEAVKRLM